MESDNDEYRSAMESLPATHHQDLHTMISDFAKSSEEVPYTALAKLISNGWKKRGVNLDEPTLSEEEQMILTGMGVTAGGFNEFLYHLEDPWLVVARQYLKACAVLCEKVQDQTATMGSLALPIIFAFRHSLELALKSILDSIARQLTSIEKPYRGHSLDNLKNLFEKVLPPTLNEYVTITGLATEEASELQILPIADDVRLLLKWAKVLNAADPRSDRFRYPVDKDGKGYEFPSLKDDLGISGTEELLGLTAQIDQAMQRIQNFLKSYQEAELGSS